MVRRRSWGWIWAGALMVAGLPTNWVRAEQIGVFFSAEGELKAVPRELPAGMDALTAALQALAAGPTDMEQAQGLVSAFPAGTTIEQLRIEQDTVFIEFSSALLTFGMDEERLEQVYRQVQGTLAQFDLDRNLRLTVAGALLSAYLPPTSRGWLKEGEAVPTPANEPVTTATGLAGKKVSISPGHGRYWHGDTWYYDRGIYCAPLNSEDDHNDEIARYLDVFLRQDGAVTKVYRCIDKSYGTFTQTGDAWWRISAAYWLKQTGYPCSVYASQTGDCNLGTGANEYSDTVRSRPLAADYDNTDAHIAIHTNAYAGNCYGTSCPNGTITYYDTSSGYGAVGQSLAQNVQNGMINVIRTQYADSTWRDRGTGDAAGQFAETRIPHRAAILIELAFHDSCDRDALYLQDNFFRSATMWGVYKGICGYLGTTPTWDFYSDEYVSDTIPSAMDPGQTVSVSVTFRNRGVLWNDAKAYSLGAVDNSDPFTTSLRVGIGGEVDTGQTHTFNFTLTAPTTPGVYTTDWRMLREWITWFGATCTKQIQVGTGLNPPSITQNPTNQSLAAGATATFTVQASGDAPLSYRWQKDAVSLSDGGNISGATTPTLQIANAATADQGSYRCVVSNPYGTATSGAATLTVTANVFIVESRTGGKNFSLYSETGTWADVTGKSTATGTTAGIGSRYGSTYRTAAGEKHAIFKANLPAAGTYEVYATWAAGQNRRTPIQHRVTHADGTTNVNVDQTATANVWVSLGTYRFEAGNLVGQVDVNNTVIDTSGSMYADAIKWDYRGSGIAAPTISKNPQVQNVCPGTTATFTVAATGSGTLSYQWQKNSANLANGGHVSGATTATLTIATADSSDLGSYGCVVTNAGGSATSTAAALTLKAGTAISQHPLPQSIMIGETATFTMVATGEGTLTYRWQKEGVDLADGGHFSGTGTSSCVVSNATLAEAGNYHCVVTGTCGSVTSAEATLTVRTQAGDFDGDQDVDLNDFGHLQSCLYGSGVAIENSECNSSDLDQDSDVDANDVAILRNCLSGSDIPASVPCVP